VHPALLWSSHDNRDHDEHIDYRHVHRSLFGWPTRAERRLGWRLRRSGLRARRGKVRVQCRSELQVLARLQLQRLLLANLHRQHLGHVQPGNGFRRRRLHEVPEQLRHFYSYDHHVDLLRRWLPCWQYSLGRIVQLGGVHAAGGSAALLRRFWLHRAAQLRMPGLLLEVLLRPGHDRGPPVGERGSYGMHQDLELLLVCDNHYNVCHDHHYGDLRGGSKRGQQRVDQPVLWEPRLSGGHRGELPQ
jgi:hypothetical protein